jgi:molecular chaperone GrpE (heat shock protein)
MGTVVTMKRMNRLRPESGYVESPGNAGQIDEKNVAKAGPSQEDLDSVRHSLENSFEDRFNKTNATLKTVMDCLKVLRQDADKTAAELDKIAALDKAVVILREEQRGKYAELRNIIAELEKEVFSEKDVPGPVEQMRSAADTYPTRPDEGIAGQLYEMRNLNPYTQTIARLTKNLWAGIGGDVESLKKEEGSKFITWFSALLEGLDRMDISGEAGDHGRLFEERIFPLIDAIDGFFRESEIPASHQKIRGEFNNYLRRVLDLYGIEEIKVEVHKDTFDGEKHQLVKTVAQQGYPLGTIIEIQKRGFSFEGTILRKPWVIQSTS